jgi:hypothetical protein
LRKGIGRAPEVVPGFVLAVGDGVEEEPGSVLGGGRRVRGGSRQLGSGRFQWGAQGGSSVVVAMGIDFCRCHGDEI